MRALGSRHRRFRLQRPQKRRRPSIDRDTLSILVAFFAASVAVAAAYFAEEQVRVSRESMMRQLRAYITLTIEDPKLDEGIVNLKVKVKNVGTTPADHVRISFVPASDEIAKRGLALSDFKDTNSTLHALAVYTLGNNEEYLANVNSNVTENDLIANRADGSLSLLLMKVDYEDIFHQWHMRPFCAYVTPLDFDYHFRVLPCNVDDAYGD